MADRWVDDARIEFRSATQTEVRLALVMNGGVSLAVWMGGVAHEIDLLRRASRGDPRESVDPSDRPVFDQWRRLASSAGKKVRVDVISGSSAGGLNALLLATAIGRGTPIPALGEIWQTCASLDNLKVQDSRKIRGHLKVVMDSLKIKDCLKVKPGIKIIKDTFKLKESEAEESLLSGKSFERMVADALSSVGDAGPSHETVTLFLTATSLDGRPRNAQDGFGQHFDIEDHRRLYRFKNQPRGWRYEYDEETKKWAFSLEVLQHFSADKNDILSLAGRATASFPGAFDPVNESRLLKYRIHPDPAYDDPASCVIDGGVLNNAPFEPVLDEITKSRVHEMPVERVLVYVVPSAGQLEGQKTKDCECSKFSPIETVTEAFGRPREVDFRSSIENIENRLKNTARDAREELFGRLVQESCDRPVVGLRSYVHGNEKLDGKRSAAVRMLGDYRYSRVRAVVREIIDKYSGRDLVKNLAAPREMETQVIEDILQKDTPLWFPPDDPRQIFMPDLGNWCWGIITAERALQTFGHHVHDILRPPDGTTSALETRRQEEIMEEAGCISDRLRKVLAVTEALNRELKSQVSRGGMDERRAADLLEKVYRKLNVQETVGRLVKDSAESYLQVLKKSEASPRWSQPEEVVSEYLTVEVLMQAFAPPRRVVERLTPKFTFLRLGPDSMGPLFHEDRLAGLRDRKLYGIHCNHFGAFVDEDWRRSDFMWGRLDAAHHLLSLFQPDDRSEEMELHKVIVEAQERRGADSIREVRRRLDRLISGNPRSDERKTRKALVRSTGRTFLKRRHYPAAFLFYFLARKPARRYKADTCIGGKRERVVRSIVTAFLRRFLALLIGLIVLFGLGFAFLLWRIF